MSDSNNLPQTTPDSQSIGDLLHSHELNYARNALARWQRYANELHFEGNRATAFPDAITALETALKLIDAQMHKIDEYETMAMYAEVQSAMTVITTGAGLRRNEHQVILEFSAEDFQRIVDYDLKVSGMYVTFAKNDIPDATDEEERADNIAYDAYINAREQAHYEALDAEDEADRD